MKLKKILISCLILFTSQIAANSWGVDRLAPPPRIDKLAEVVQKAMPSVGFILTECNYFDLWHAENPDSYYQSYPEYFEWLRGVHGWMFPSDYWTGSGVFIDEEGYMVTCAHVANSATTIYVVLQDSKRRINKATVVYQDESIDLAILKVDSGEEQPFPHLKLGDSDRLRPGDFVAALGTPKGKNFEASASFGIVSGTERYGYCVDATEGFIQTDAALNGGNSGGPLINMRGEVIGLNEWMFTFNKGMGFSLPSNLIARVVKQVKEQGEVLQGFMGIFLENSVESIFDVWAIDKREGAVISEVLTGSAAEKAGLEKGDIICAINGVEIFNPNHLKTHCYARAPSEKVCIDIVRDEKEITKTVILEEGDYYTYTWFKGIGDPI